MRQDSKAMLKSESIKKNYKTLRIHKEHDNLKLKLALITLLMS